MCGATLTTDSTPAARTWRAIVDRLGLLVAVWATAAFVLNQPARLVLT